MRMHNTNIKFLQINLQHSRAATNNLMKTIEEDNIDVICIQEPDVINNKVIGIQRKYKILAHGEHTHSAGKHNRRNSNTPAHRPHNRTLYDIPYII
jgi:exonuclease III